MVVWNKLIEIRLLLISRREYSLVFFCLLEYRLTRDISSSLYSGDIPIVIATSVAARGLDVKQLRLVIQYDAPNHMEDYVHRAGRTGRAGQKGTCVTFVTPEQDRYALDIFKALVASSATIPVELKELAEGE